MDTIFSKIIEGVIPATKVYEDEEALAFLDIHPKSKGHTLLISKEPYEWMQDVPDELLGAMFIKAKKLMIAMKKGLGCDYVKVTIVGKDVPHFHIHLIPRFFNDDIHTGPALSYDDGEKEHYAEKIKNAF